MTLEFQVESILREKISKSSEIYFLCNYRDSNIGDSAIAHATFQLLDRLGLKYWIFLPYSLPFLHKSKIASRLNNSGTTILLPGGGNFGGLYPWNDLHRIWCLENLPKAKIVQLPQSIHFVSTKEEYKLKKSFEAHKNVTILVRDQPSLNRIKDWKVEKILCPDLVETLPMRKNLGKVENGYLVRDDNESISSISLHGDQEFFDWPRINFFSRGAYRFLRLIHNLIPTRYSESFEWNSKGFNRTKTFHRNRTETGFLMVERYSNLHTDRLHGLILGQKASCKVVFGDNTNQKVSSYYKTWYK
jgi:pyruvyl transferase EpsO